MTRAIEQAGQRLAAALVEYAGTDTVILGVGPRGLALAAEVAHTLSLPLDVVAVQKIPAGGPGYPHVGAVAEPDHVVLNRGALRQLAPPAGWVEATVTAAIREVERRRTICRGDRRRCEVTGRRAIVVAHSAGTGTTLRAALAAVRAQRPREIVVALAVAPTAVIAALREEGGRVVCLATPLQHIIGDIHESLVDDDGDEDIRRLLEHSAMCAGQ
jgi:putative phosphoribosyl transferase